MIQLRVGDSLGFRAVPPSLLVRYELQRLFEPSILVCFCFCIVVVSLYDAGTGHSVLKLQYSVQSIHTLKRILEFGECGIIILVYSFIV